MTNEAIANCHPLSAPTAEQHCLWLIAPFLFCCPLYWPMPFILTKSVSPSRIVGTRCRCNTKTKGKRCLITCLDNRGGFVRVCPNKRTNYDHTHTNSLQSNDKRSIHHGGTCRRWCPGEWSLSRTFSQCSGGSFLNELLLPQTVWFTVAHLPFSDNCPQNWTRRAHILGRAFRLQFFWRFTQCLCPVNFHWAELCPV